MNLLFVDLETTGLDPATDSILEVAWVLTALAPGLPVLESLSGGSAMVELHESPRMTHDVWAMHLASGLWEDWARGDHHPLPHLLEELDEVIEMHGNPYQTILAGHGVHFDRSFLHAAAPGFVESLHYRLFDVRTLEMAAEVAGVVVEDRVGTQHRATDDVAHSLRVARSITGQMGQTT